MPASWEYDDDVTLENCYHWIRSPNNYKLFQDKLKLYPNIHIDLRLDYLLYHDKEVYIHDTTINAETIQSLLFHAIYYDHTQLLDLVLEIYPYMCKHIMYSLFNHLYPLKSYNFFEHILKRYNKYVFYDYEVATMLYLKDIRLFITYMNHVEKILDNKKAIIIKIHNKYFSKYKIQQNINKVTYI